MKKVLLALVLLGTLSYAQVITTAVELIPATDSSGAGLAPGQLRFRGLSNSVQFRAYSSASHTLSFYDYLLDPAITLTPHLVTIPYDLTILGVCTGCSGAPANMMTTDTAQTVTGDKTFTSNILFTNNNTVVIGSDALRANTIYSNAIDVTPTSGGSIANYIAARRVLVRDQAGGVGGWDIISTGTTATSQLEIRDTVNADVLRLTRNTAFIVQNQGSVDMHWAPMTDNTRDLGNLTNHWRDLNLSRNLVIGSTTVIDSARNGTFNNLTIGGTCSGCGTSPADMMTTDTNQTVTGLKTFANSILFNANNAYIIGNGTNRPNTIYSNAVDVAPVGGGLGNFMAARRVLVYDQGGANAGVDIIANANTLTGNVEFDFRDTASQPILILRRTFFSSTINQAILDMTFVPLTSNVRDLGTNSQLWRDLQLGRDLYLGRDLLVQPSGNIRMQNGNFYNRTFFGTPSCSGVADGWAGYDTSGDHLWICSGGIAHAH